MGVNNFSFWILLARLYKYALSDFHVFSGPTPINHNVGPTYPLSPHTNTFVGSAWPELVTNSLLCKNEKSEDDRKRTYLQVTQKHEVTEELKARQLPRT